MERKENTERLSNPALKMAAILMADFPVFQSLVQEACKREKQLCLEASCLTMLLAPF